MSGPGNVYLYFVMVLSVVVLPGMDMAFVMASSVAGGRKTGFAAVGGIMAGGVCHMLIGASGVFALVALVPGALRAMLFVGVAYVAWIGWTLVSLRTLVIPTVAAGTRTMRATFFAAIATSLLNPKAYLFMLAIFPQFVHPEQGSVWIQALAPGLITAATQLAVYGAMALLAAHLQTRFIARPGGGIVIARGAGAVLLAAAAFTLARGLAQVAR